MERSVLRLRYGDFLRCLLWRWRLCQVLAKVRADTLHVAMRRAHRIIARCDRSLLKAAFRTWGMMRGIRVAFFTIQRPPAP